MGKSKGFGPGDQKAAAPATPAAFSSGVFALALDALRLAYENQLSALLGIIRPRIEAGEFSDIGDGFGYVRKGSPEARAVASDAFTGCADGDGWLEVDPGICLLERKIRRIQFIQASLRDRQFVASVLCVTAHVWDGDALDDKQAALECLTYDLRALFRARGGTLPALASPNWRIRKPRKAARK